LSHIRISKNINAGIKFPVAIAHINNRININHPTNHKKNFMKEIMEIIVPLSFIFLNSSLKKESYAAQSINRINPNYRNIMIIPS